MATNRTPPQDPSTESGTADLDQQATNTRQRQDAPLMDGPPADQNTTTDPMIKNKI